jgi:uncharacterized protein (DUF2147 family)
MYPGLRFGLPLLVSTLVQAHDGADITGLWRTIDDETRQPAALVEIVAEHGEYRARVVQLLDPAAPTLCTACSGARHNQPIVGMTILTGLKRSGEAFVGGEILDPDSGDTYRAQAHLIDAGRRLAVRGYIGLSLFGRSQVWERQAPLTLPPARP